MLMTCLEYVRTYVHSIGCPFTLFTRLWTAQIRRDHVHRSICKETVRSSSLHARGRNGIGVSSPISKHNTLIQPGVQLQANSKYEINKQTNKVLSRELTWPHREEARCGWRPHARLDGSPHRTTCPLFYYFFPRDGENQRIAVACMGCCAHRMGLPPPPPAARTYRTGEGAGHEGTGGGGALNAPPAGGWTRAPAPPAPALRAARQLLPSPLRSSSSRRRPRLLRRRARAPSFLRVPTCMHLLIKRLSTYRC